MSDNKSIARFRFIQLGPDDLVWPQKVLAGVNFGCQVCIHIMFECNMKITCINRKMQAFIVSTDIAEDFMTYYFELMIRFDQRHMPNLFLFVPLGDISRNIPDAILNHRLADGIHLSRFILYLHIHIFECRRSGHYNCGSN